MGGLSEKHLESAFKDLNELWDKLGSLESAVESFAEKAPEFVQDQVDRTLARLRSFEPSISVIGQVKAGKSTLLNALLGQDALLPSDVNPWTSVITGVHLNSRKRPMNTRALFRFFDAQEWERLVSTGGRLGEMAMRVGFENEADEVKSQVMEMRQTTEDRLGDEFEKLLGSSHSFKDLDKDTIDRYICYGDPDDMENGSQEGVYADLTKTADLYLDLPGYPRGICIRDTPGVNDTFMMREQITLNAISESRVCVVVLSAHQALSTMDMALLRIICAVQAREVVIFVNRMDELEDPAGEEEKIRASINKVLERMGIGQDLTIIFGSGYWAEYGSRDKLADLNESSFSSLEAWAKTKGEAFNTKAEQNEAAIKASGIMQIYEAISTRIISGPGEALLRDTSAEIDNMVNMSEKVVSIARLGGASGGDAARIISDAMGAADNVLKTVKSSYDEDVAEIEAFLRKRLNTAQDQFISSALVALDSHIESFGERDQWNHDPMGLRMIMRTSYLTACTKLERKAAARLDDVADGYREILEGDLGIYADDLVPELPTFPDASSPTNLAQTLSLDLEGSWWNKFWRIGAKKKIRAKYEAVLREETNPLLESLMENYFSRHVGRIFDVIDRFNDDQRGFLSAILDCAESAENDGSAHGKASKGSIARDVA